MQKDIAFGCNEINLFTDEYLYLYLLKMSKYMYILDI